MVRIDLSMFTTVGDCSLVTKACIDSWSLDRSETEDEIGRRRSSIVRSTEVLKQHMSSSFGTGVFELVLRWISSLIMEMKGVIPLPPLTIISESCLHRM